MWHTAFGVVLGVLFAPVIKQVTRPALRGVMRVGIKAGRGVRNATANLKEDLEDLAAEATYDEQPVLEVEKPVTPERTKRREPRDRRTPTDNWSQE